MRKERGITLIALIITIIVMLILVGVTINVALNGNLLGKAKEAARRTEEQSIYEKISGSVCFEDNGKIKVKETYEAAKRVIEEEGKTLRLISPTTEDKITEGTTGIAFEVEGKNGTYTYTITTEKIIIGKDNTINDFEITISKSTGTSVYGLVNQVTLQITPTIPESWQNPKFTEAEAVKFVADQMGLTGVTTLEQLVVELYNMYTQIDEAENPLYGKPTVDSFEELSVELKDEIGSENNPTAKEVIAFMLNAFGAPYTTVEELAADMYEYEAKTKVLRVNGEEVTANWSKHEVYHYTIEGNGTYEIEMELDGKKSRQTVEITEIESMGTYVKYDSDSDGDLEDETLYIVLYEEGELGEEYGAQIIPADVSKMPSSILGYDDPTIDETKVEQIDDEEAISPAEKAIYVRNNLVEILNKKCEAIVTEKEGITNGVRSLGSDPREPYKDETEMFYKTSILGYDEIKNDWFDIYDGKIKKGNTTDEPEDITIIRAKDIRINPNITYNTEVSVALARRLPMSLSDNKIYANGTCYTAQGKTFTKGGIKEEIGTWLVVGPIYLGYNDNGVYINVYSSEVTLCPVISLVPGVLDNATGKGTERDPLILK